MTLRAVILGLIGSAFIAGVTFVNDAPLQLDFLVGNQFPISVFGLLVVVMVVVNPLLRAARRRARLRPGEIALALALMLVACSVPGAGLYRTFPPAVAMPVFYNQQSAGWRKNKVLAYTPSAMLVNSGRYDSEVIGGFRTGMRGESDIPLSAVPWSAWRGVLAAWMPLIVLCAVAVICLSLIVHRQWSQHERLRYPIAMVAGTLMDAGGGPASPSVYRRRAFWLGAGAIVFINVVNYIHVWSPRSIEIPLKLDLRPILYQYRTLARTPGAWRVMQPVLYPTAVAFAYFLASDVSFSMGISQIVFMAIAAALVAAGVDISENRMDGGVFAWQRSGSYFALALLLLYIGRRYYAETVKAAVTFRAGRRGQPYAVWACRVLLACVAGMTAILAAFGLDWPFALLLILIVLMMFVVLARIVAESGLILAQALWTPAAVFIGLFGYEALGPRAICIIGMVCCVLIIDPRESLMPFLVNALKIGDSHGIRPSRLGAGAVAIYLMALAVALPVVLWANYNYGRPSWDIFSTRIVPKLTHNAAGRAVTKLRLSGQLAESENYTAWQRIANARPQEKYLWSAGAGMAAVLVCSVLRLRFSWWPIHPIMFLGWGSWGLKVLCHSFLLGWLIKMVVTRLGGSRTYRRVQPLMIGVIAGDLLSGLAFMITGATYYATTGLIPKLFRILPG